MNTDWHGQHVPENFIQTVEKLKEYLQMRSVFYDPINSKRVGRADQHVQWKWQIHVQEDQSILIIRLDCRSIH